jgi:hypothetical protein
MQTSPPTPLHCVERGGKKGDAMGQRVCCDKRDYHFAVKFDFVI